MGSCHGFANAVGETFYNVGFLENSFDVGVDIDDCMYVLYTKNTMWLKKQE